MTSWRRVPAIVVGLLLFCATALPYYHFLHYPSFNTPLNPAPEKFDLGALAHKTVYLYVSDLGPGTYAPNDSYESLLSEIRLAAQVWNDVPTSDLRVAYGGQFSPGTPHATPGVEVVFEELPPGLIAMGGPVSRGDLVTTDSGAYVPITRSVMVLPKDASVRASYSESFFLTIVHEIGHTLGLQHTLTSSVMSTSFTRATTRSKPIGPDDVAGISLLYPASGFLSQVGTITGSVTAHGSGVHMASVVALSPGGASISTLTAPDGTYRLQGLPPGHYYLYVHALPPIQQDDVGPADILLPLGPDNQPIPASGPFQTQFYPGTTDWQQAAPVSVAAGASQDGLNFSVTPVSNLQLYGVTTYSFPGQVAVKPAFVNISGTRPFLVASGADLVNNNKPTPGLNVSVIGGSASVAENGVYAYSYAPTFLQVNLNFNPFSAFGPRHLVFSQGFDIYVLPAGLNLVNKQPPAIKSVAPGTDAQGRSVAVISGSDFTAQTRFFFDGIPTTVSNVDSTTGDVTVVLPAGSSNHLANVIAVDGDGQSSLFLDANPKTYTYTGSDAPDIRSSPNHLPAGVESMVEVTGTNTDFTKAVPVVGYGSSDVVVRRLWVTSPTRILANVLVAPLAPAGQTMFSVTTGFQALPRPFAFNIDAADPKVPVLDSSIINPDTNFSSLYAGGPAVVSVRDLPDPVKPADLRLTFNDKPVTIAGVEKGQIRFLVPADAGLGPSVLKLTVGGQTSYPIVIAIDPPPPLVTAILDGANQPISNSNPILATSLLRLRITRLSSGDSAVTADRVKLVLGGVQYSPAAIQQASDDKDSYLVDFKPATTLTPGDAVPLVLFFDGRPSLPSTVSVAQPQTSE